MQKDLQIPSTFSTAFQGDTKSLFYPFVDDSQFFHTQKAIELLLSPLSMTATRGQ